ncbi:transketolase [uncultured Desulfuromonas sp.]|uniref:transketolase n=1 Tax=uncultured Desulfuromonas sp. TaxID=181013 RepID=UPI002AAB201C|nr:transketolase [uncultured Desulfuromonas sp.]
MHAETFDPVLAKQTIDTIRLLSADAVEKANSGHPGTPMEGAPLAYLIYTRHLRHNPENPVWPGRDRFILSCGHASMLLYSTLHLSGYDISLDDLKNFRQFGSKTPGHPEFGHTPGVETTTGPLGQGIAVGTGMAMGARYLQKNLDKDLFDYTVYAICSDGDVMEGVASEAASLAGHLKLGNLVYLYLDNKITIEGDTSLAFSEEVATRYLAYGWHVERVTGENLAEVDAAIERAKRDPRPSMIITRTNIGQGAPNKQGTAAAHGAPLGTDELALAKQALGFDPEQSFAVPESVYTHMAQLKERGQKLETAWNQECQQKCATNTALADWYSDSELSAEQIDALLPTFEAGSSAATRSSSGQVLNALAAGLPMMLGGSADLAPSNNTHLKGEEAFTPEAAGRNIHFGIREHAMGSILNGLCHTRGLLPFGATFMIFSDYMRPPMRMAALMGIAPVYVLTHDSIGVGEDGPTHQPIEQLCGLRSVPNLTVLRPCDANETAQAWKAALINRQGPTALILTRQNLPTLDRNQYASADGVQKGAYVLAAEEGDLQLILMASGSEVQHALAAREILHQQGVGVRVVSMPSWELFENQDSAYKEEVLPSACRARLAVEAASTFGWERYIGLDGAIVGMTGFGASAPGGQLMDHFGFTTDNVVAKAKELIG